MWWLRVGSILEYDFFFFNYFNTHILRSNTCTILYIYLFIHKCVRCVPLCARVQNIDDVPIANLSRRFDSICVVGVVHLYLLVRIFSLL